MLQWLRQNCCFVWDTFTSQGNELISALIRFNCSTRYQWVLAGMGVVEGLTQRREQRWTCSAKRRSHINCGISWSYRITISFHPVSSAWSKPSVGSSQDQQEAKVIYSTSNMSSLFPLQLCWVEGWVLLGWWSEIPSTEHAERLSSWLTPHKGSVWGACLPLSAKRSLRWS